MTRVAHHMYISDGQGRCAAIIGGSVCNAMEDTVYHGPLDWTDGHAPVQLSTQDLVTQAIEAAKQAQAFADQMVTDSTASKRMLAEVWCRVSEAWSKCAAVSNMDSREFTEDAPEPHDWEQEALTLAEHLNQAQRIIAALFERLETDSIVMSKMDWDRLNGANITVTATGDGNRVVRRAS